ncbi:MAG: dynamin family protein [Pseudomonadota bacterium]
MSYLQDQLAADERIHELKQVVDSIYGWMENHEFHSEQTRQRFARVRQRLDNKQRRILFLAEYSRGKSELINATIFGAMGKRYLPSTPGRTTRCTTEIHYDNDQLPSIRLLPTISSLEVQRQPVSLLVHDSELWDQTLFSAGDPDGVIESLKKISETEMVTPEVAFQLGFIKKLDDDVVSKLDMVDGRIEIPKWRHAIINFPHPLLKQGLSILDTPGYNALGVEPELTFQAMDTANAIVFVLAADTGVTRSDMEIWNAHVKDSNVDNVLVVLNKIDMLWDEIKSEELIQKQIKQQIRDVARILDISEQQVYPITAQKALLGRKKNDSRLIASSGILKYERALADAINSSNRRGVVSRAVTEIAAPLQAIERVLTQRVEATLHHVGEINKSKTSQSDITENNIEQVKKETARLRSVSEKVNLFRVDLKVDYEKFLNKLDIFFLDKMIARYRLEISNQLTTPGLQREMNDFQEVAVDRFKEALSHISRLEQKLQKVFDSVENILGVKGLKPRRVRPEVYLNALQNFREKHQEYTSGLSMVMTEQNALRDRYHASVMVKIRRLYAQTRDEIELWCRTVMVPLELEIKERENQLKRRLLSLERIRRKDTDLDEELHVLNARVNKHQQRLNALNHFKQRMEELANKDNIDVTNIIDMQSHHLAG